MYMDMLLPNTQKRQENYAKGLITKPCGIFSDKEQNMS